MGRVTSVTSWSRPKLLRKLKMAAAQSKWQKSLRQSMDPVQKLKDSKVDKRRTERLRSIAGDEDVFDENVLVLKKNQPERGRRRERLSTRDSVSESVQEKVEPQSPRKVEISQSFLRPIPQLSFLKTSQDVPSKEAKSPIPLPDGVFNIDPIDDNSHPYGQVISNYKLNQDLESTKNLKKVPLSSRMADGRKKLLDWLLSIAHHFNCSQETLYFAIDIFDRYLALPGINIKIQDIQLIGITCYFMATKLDEYYQADINELANLTNGSSSASNIRSMERQILSSLDFKLHCGRAPMVFLNRLLRAAYTKRSDIGYEISILAMDILVLERKFLNENSLKKAAAAVMAARKILLAMDEIDGHDEIWTPNLKYYSTYEKNSENLEDMVKHIIMSVKQLLGKIHVQGDERPN